MGKKGKVLTFFKRGKMEEDWVDRTTTSKVKGITGKNSRKIL